MYCDINTWVSLLLGHTLFLLHLSTFLELMIRLSEVSHWKNDSCFSYNDLGCRMVHRCSRLLLLYMMHRTFSTVDRYGLQAGQTILLSTTPWFSNLCRAKPVIVLLKTIC